MPQLFQRGFTHGKENGTGLGLYHAKTQIENLGGKVEISSTVNIGTTLTLLIPTAPAPEWFISSIDFSKYDSVVIIDDDVSIHELWKSKIKNKDIYTFSKVQDFEHWFTSDESYNIGRIVYLMDYNLNDPLSGIDLIEKLSISKKSILVTSEIENPNLIQRANWIGVKVMPKVLI